MDRRCTAVEYVLFAIALIPLPAPAFSQQTSSPAPIDHTNVERARQQENATNDDRRFQIHEVLKGNLLEILLALK